MFSRGKRVAVAGMVAALIACVAAPAASAADCVSVNVKVLGQTVAACVPVSQLPTIEVPGPRVTINVPGPVRTVSVPGPTKTVTKTVTNSVPGPTVTRNVNSTQNSTATVTKNSTSRATVTKNSTSQSTVTQETFTTATPKPGEKVITEDETKTVTITRLKAVGISLGLVLLGALIALLLIAGAYRLGWRLGDNGNRAFIKNELEKNRHVRQH